MSDADLSSRLERFSATFQHDGISVIAGVTNVHRVDRGLAATIVFSFRDQTRTYGLTHYGGPESFEASLVKAMQEQAPEMAKHFRGVGNIPQRFLGVEFQTQYEWWSSWISVYSAANTLTILEAGLGQTLPLVNSGTTATLTGKDGTESTVPVYRIRARVQNEEFDMRVILAKFEGAPCVLGREVGDYLVAKNPKNYFALHSSHAYLDAALSAGLLSKESTILLLGSYDEPHKDRLNRIRAELFKNGYRAVMLSDVADISDHTLEEKLLLLGALAKGVIVIDDVPSGHLVEIAICTRAGFTTAVLASQVNHLSTAMIADLEGRHKRFKTWNSASNSCSVEVVSEILDWIEETRLKKVESLDKHYEWRNAVRKK